MKKLFVPSKWENKCDVLKFTPIKGNLSDNVSERVNKAEKQKTKIKSHHPEKKAQENDPKIKTTRTIKTSSPTCPKIKAGRIVKKKKSLLKQKKRLKRTPAIVAAGVKSQTAPSGDNDKESTNSSSISTLQAKLKEQLVGGRFRFINEQLYSIDSSKAQKLFLQDPEAFHAYHAGYRHQVEQWPLDPLKRIIKMIKKLPKTLDIGDFGCGEGKLAKSVPHKVYSMDLISCRDDIIACDMANTPLPSHSLDVAVYCLSLMGTNLNEYLLEANRLLKDGGFLYIAEIQSRFDNVYTFVKCLEGCGFQLLKKDVGVKLFYFFQFKKVRDVGRVTRLQPYSLKPCLYRKR